MASHAVSHSRFGDYSHVHNGNVYNNWPAGQAQNDSDNVYLQHLRITDPRLDKKRILETNGPLLWDSCRWIFDHRDYQQWLDAQNGILWIKGDPGKGKTMLLCGIIESLEEDEEVETELAYFFCQATDARINAAAAILAGLTFYLARRKRSLLSYVRERHLGSGKSLLDGPNGWVTICDIFEAVIQDSTWSRLVLVVDALDECVTDRDSFLRLVVKTSSKVKWLLSSRNLEDIERRLLSKESVNPLSLELKENAESVSRAVHSYIEYCVAHMEIIQKNKELEGKVRDILQRKADNTFLWAALAIQQLQDALKWEVLPILDQMPEGLQSLYQLMMNQIQGHPIQRRNLCVKLLSIVTTAYRPLRLGELGSLWQMEAECPQGQESVRTIAQLCGSFLTVKDDTIHFIHQSAKDYVLHQGSQASIASQHFYMFKSSLDVMSQKLHRNMYGLESPSTQIDEISTPCPDPLAYLRYQCTFWIDHLLATSVEERAEAIRDHGSLYLFFKTVYPYWLEAISLLRAMDHTIGALYRLSTLAFKEQDTPGLKALMEDAIRFFQSNRGIIEVVPLQTYSSAMIFAPECSIIRQEFEKTVCQGIPLVFNRPKTWGACIHTLLGHKDEITSVAFSSTSHLLISNSRDGTARIWEMGTGNCQQILLFGNYHWLVQISPDSKKVASSDSTRIYIWNTDTGEKMHTLHGDGRNLQSIAFAADSKLLASAYPDKTVCIRCTETGQLLQTLQCYEGECNEHLIRLAFSPDMRYVVAADKFAATVWDIETADEIFNSPRQGEGTILAVAFSPNSKLLASAHCHWPSLELRSSPDSCINVWCIATGRKLKSCHTRCCSLLLEKLAFSSNTELAVPTTKGLCHWRFQSSSDLDDTISDSNVYKLSKIDFSFDMAFFAGSEPSIHTISVWQLNSSDNSTGALDKYVSSRYDITSVVISPDSSVVASSSFDTAVTLWRTDTGQRCQIFTGPIQVTAITFSHDSSIMVTCDTKRILRFWQTATGECINVSSMLECNTAKASDWGYIIHHMAASADLGILALGGYDVIFVLRKDNDKAYKCIAQYPAPKKANRSMYIEHVAVSLTSAFVSWASAEYSEDSKENQLILEHWRIDTENAIELHVGHKHRSISYQEKNNGLIIPGHKYWLRTLATGRFAWITQKEERLLWIPKEFRPRSAWHWDSSGSILAIGGNANIVLIIDFSRQPDTIVSEEGGVESLKRKTRASSFDVITETMFEEEENV